MVFIHRVGEDRPKLTQLSEATGCFSNKRRRVLGALWLVVDLQIMVWVAVIGAGTKICF